MLKKENIKLVRNKGWAFSEESDFSKLEELAKEGWILKSLARGGYYYKLEKEAPQNLQYSLDIYNGNKEEYLEYLEMFEMAGWQAVCRLGKGSAGTYTIFKSSEGTTPIYSDKNSLKESYKEQKISSLKGLFASLITYLLFGFFNLLLWPVIIVASLIVGGLAGGISGIVGFWNII